MPANPSLTVSVAFTGSTFYIFAVVQVSGADGAGSLDAVSSGAIGNSTTSSDPISTVTPYDLVIACDCSVRGTGTITSGGGFSADATLGGPSGPVVGSDVYLNVFYSNATAAGSFNSSLSYATAEPFAVITVGLRPSTAWPGVSGRPYVTVSPVGIANGEAAVANNGADFGPDTPSTSTSGIQEALNSIAATGGTVFCTRGDYVLENGIAFTGSIQRLEFAAGSQISFANGLTGIRPNWTSVDNSLPYCLFLMGAPATSSSPSPFSHQWFVGNGVSILWGSNATLTGFTIASPGPDSSPPYSGQGGEDFLIEGVISSGYIGECFGVHAQYSAQSGVAISQHTRHIIVRQFYDTRAALTTGGSGFAVVGNVFGMLIEDVEIDLSQASGGTGLSNCFIAGYQGGVLNITVRRCRFISNPSDPSGTYPNQVLELQGNGLSGTTTDGVSDVLIEDTLFDSGASSGFANAGFGGAYIDDNDGTTGVGFVNRVTFRNCQWRNCGMQLQSAGATPGYIKFEGSMPGEFYPFGTGLASLGGRPILPVPNLSGNGLYEATAAQVGLPTSGITIAQFTPVTGLVGIFRIVVNVAAVGPDSAIVNVTWHDPNAGNQTMTLINSSLGANKVTSASLTIVADSGATITVSGNAVNYSNTLFGSAAITQVG